MRAVQTAASVIATVALFAVLQSNWTDTAVAVSATEPEGGFVIPAWEDDGATARAQQRDGLGGLAPGSGTETPSGTNRAVLGPDPNEYRLTLACGSRRMSSVGGSEDAGSCQGAYTACQAWTPPQPGPMYFIWTRPKSPPGGAWAFSGRTCGGRDLPAEVAVPAVPSMAQIRAAFLRLPFAKPVVRVQPVGGVTLVNLPTYYEATWPGDARLAPGEVSKPVKLLSWTVQFEVSVKDYRYRWGDGASSEVTTDPGGPYPTGRVVHTYDRALARAPVAVDARLTGRFRANGGEWVDLDAVADLQEEPVTMLAVKEARARLVGP
jgi:hypothetical protein